jgi:hypothetical protein
MKKPIDAILQSSYSSIRSPSDNCHNSTSYDRCFYEAKAYAPT